MSEKWVDETLNSLSLEEKVGQLVMASCFDLGNGFPAYLEKLEKYPLGGVFIFFGTHQHLSKRISQLQKDRKVPLLMGCDYESGAGYIVENGTRFTRQMARGWAGNEKTEYKIGRITAEEGSSLGMNMTMSPILDVNDDFRCPDTNIRAYSDEPKAVCRLGVPYVKGIQENGMLSAGKHFPGNGGGGMDQHVSASLILDSREDMIKRRLAPFQAAIDKADLAGIMVGHLEVPSLTRENNPRTGRAVPTSLSREVLTDLLRGEMGFKGLVITDALDMGGVTNQYTREEAAVKAINAGVDMLLVFSAGNWHREYVALLEAAKTGGLKSKRLDEAVRQVLKTKARIGLHEGRGLPKPEKVRAKIYKVGKNEAFSQGIADRAVTVLWNRTGTLPLKKVKGKKLLLINILSPERKTMEMHGQKVPVLKMHEMLKKRGAKVSVYEMCNDTPYGEVQAMMNKLAKSDAVLLNFIAIPSWGIATTTPNRVGLGLFYHGIFMLGPPVVVTAFGDPWMAYYCPTAPSYVATFDEGLYSQEAAVKVWCGEHKATGRMPVSLEGIFKRGDGIDT